MLWTPILVFAAFALPVVAICVYTSRYVFIILRGKRTRVEIDQPGVNPPIDKQS